MAKLAAQTEARPIKKRRKRAVKAVLVYLTLVSGAVAYDSIGDPSVALPIAPPMPVTAPDASEPPDE